MEQKASAPQSLDRFSIQLYTLCFSRAIRALCCIFDTVSFSPKMSLDMACGIGRSDLQFERAVIVSLERGQKKDTHHSASLVVRNTAYRYCTNGGRGPYSRVGMKYNWKSSTIERVQVWKQDTRKGKGI